MNRAEIARNLLLTHFGHRVTISMLKSAGISAYTARNAIAEAKKTFNEKEYRIRHEYHKKGEDVFDNGWILEKISGAEPKPQKCGGEHKSHEPALVVRPPAPLILDANGQIRMFQ